MDTFADDDFSDLSEDEPSQVSEESLDIDIEDPKTEREEYVEEDIDIDLDAVGLSLIHI